MMRHLSIAMGLMALFTTLVFICSCVVIAVHVPVASFVRTTSLISAILQAIVWIMLGWFILTSISDSLASHLRRSSTKNLAIAFGCAVAACILSAAVAVANVVFLREDHRRSHAPESYITAASVMLPISFICQVGFLALYFFVCRRSYFDGSESLHTSDSFPKPTIRGRVKAIPYSRTRPSTADSRGLQPIDSMDLASLYSKKRAAVSTTSPRSSMSQSIRPSTSKSRLISAKERQGMSSPDSSFSGRGSDEKDCWDAMSASSYHTLEASPSSQPKPRFLETIPASPVLSQTPSFDSIPELEPPAPIGCRSRSYSPGGRKPRQMCQSPDISTEELNIHPLFRSDSPTPPPIATPGTVVVASPDAGKVLLHRPSNQSLRRMYSSSSMAASSPLSRRNSFEAPSLRRAIDQESIMEVEEGDETETEDHGSPIPPFVMGAGNRDSLTRYNSRRQSSAGEEQTDLSK